MHHSYLTIPINGAAPLIPFSFTYDINHIDGSYGYITRLIENRILQFPYNGFGICEAIEHLGDKFEIYLYPHWEFLVRSDLVVVNHYKDYVAIILRDNSKNLLKHVLCFDNDDKIFFLNGVEKLIKKSIIIKNEENDERTFNH